MHRLPSSRGIKVYLPPQPPQERISSAIQWRGHVWQPLRTRIAEPSLILGLLDSSHKQFPSGVRQERMVDLLAKSFRLSDIIFGKVSRGSHVHFQLINNVLIHREPGSGLDYKKSNVL